MKEFLESVMPYAAKSGRVAKYAEAFEYTCQKYSVNTPERLSMFAAQLAHESGEFKYVQEIASGEAYEGRKDLGNDYPGDGIKYKGRGFGQVTGRFNYAQYSKYSGQDFVAQPALLEELPWAMDSFGWFWHTRNLNTLAEGPDALIKCTKRINGGLNGLKDRGQYYAKAKQYFKLMEEGTVPIPAILSAVVGSLIQSAPVLIELFKDKEQPVSERNVTLATELVTIAKTVTGAVNEQAAAEIIEKDPEVKAKFEEAVKENWYSLQEIGGGIQAAYERNQKEEPIGRLEKWGLTIRFHQILAIMMVTGGYGTGVAYLFWGNPSQDVKALLVGAMVIGALEAIRGYYYGSTSGSAHKSELLAKSR